MNSSMAIPTYWNYIEPMLWFIAVPMMILGGLISAFYTRERRCSRYQTIDNLGVNGVFRHSLFWIVFLVFCMHSTLDRFSAIGGPVVLLCCLEFFTLPMPFHCYFAFFCLLVLFHGRFTFDRTIVATFCDLSLWCLSICLDLFFLAYFTVILTFIWISSMFIEFCKRFDFLAFSASLGYDWLRHFRSLKRLCLELVTVQSVTSSLYIKG